MRFINNDTDRTLTNSHSQVGAGRALRRMSLALFVAFAALAVSACELETEEDADAVDAAGADATAQPAETAPFRFVRITDQSTRSNTKNGGADIDAVVLTKQDGSRHAASTVEAFAHGGGNFEGPDLNPMAALGMPDSFYNYPSTTRCDADAGYVSLGGSGGYLVVGMDAEIESGDALTVLEVGGCDYGDGTAIAEPVMVEVAVASDFTSQWVYVGTGTGPSVSLNVPTLPDVPVETEVDDEIQ